MLKLHVTIFVIILTAMPCFALEQIPATWRKIFVSVSEGNDANQGYMHAAVQSLTRAKSIAAGSSAAGFAIFLKGGENHTPVGPMVSQALVDYCSYRYRSAFIWDIDKPLLLSTYGNDRLAQLGPGTETSTSSQTQVDPYALQTGISVCSPCRSQVTIENVYFYRWELGGIFPYQYLPVDPQNRLTIQNCVFEEIGTLYFPDETFLEPGHDYTIYAADVIQARESRQVDIRNNVFKNANNYLDYWHTTPFLMDSFHVFYISHAQDILIENNIIIQSSGTPVKAKHADTYNVLVRNNAFFYTSPSQQLETVQEGFVRCVEYAYVTVENNVFYCPFVWSGHEDPDTAAASLSSGDSTDRITWIANDFELNYLTQDPGTYFLETAALPIYPGSFTRRYFDGSDFVTVSLPDWQPDAQAALPFQTASTPAIERLLNVKYNSWFHSRDFTSCNGTGWTLNALFGTDAQGRIISRGQRNDGMKEGWIILDPISGEYVDENHFDHTDCLNEFSIETSNTSSQSYSVNDAGNSRLSFYGMQADQDVKWTNFGLVRSITSLDDFYIDFKMDWTQDDPADMPFGSLFLYSGGSLLGVIGLEDKSDVDFGTVHSYLAYGQGSITADQPAAAVETVHWVVTRQNGHLTVFLDGTVFHEADESRPLDQVKIMFQGRYVRHSSVGWDWGPSMPIINVDLLRIQSSPGEEYSPDFNEDGRINLQDAAYIQAFWNHSQCGWVRDCLGCDNDLSGTVDMADLFIFVDSWLN